MSSVISATGLTYGYRPAEPIVTCFDLTVAKGEWLGIVGPNGSGKSTALRLLARLAKPQQGTAKLNDRDMAGMSRKAIARQLTMLLQTQEAAVDVTVRELVRRGRNPHLRWFEESRGDHESVIDWALRATSMTKLQHRSLLALSGGERQRAWLAMCMAQTPGTLLLDEPTTYLDIAHQLELMELVRALNREQGLTVVMVLHDLNQAARYCDRIVAMKQGKIVRQGRPAELFQADFFRDVFGIEAKVHLDGGIPVCLPCGVSAHPSNQEEESQR